MPLARIAELTSTRPARIFGLERKGELLPGRDADFVVVDLELEQTVMRSYDDRRALAEAILAHHLVA